ncbi:uncharacterized protein LOC103724194 isoform X1 [Phoenix dactylifera]|uniref:Uncharacterized protein LOC103724194 isoform X1 n=1 Tax=Phoenix dactylifera TaxID=42345 RepID=A0A8B9A620_PHODC|nr:uncharacterized protein LOC103724194 isoform X1 [Phoenix dactylifera]XP_038982094.1 uncharacterized protein LOC103724194 isoform X1 [Phoenix dactylifera]XP_038982096.1 uncharacterized protein LOC103724194 isoform X1 [Phoenix dactylifera]
MGELLILVYTYRRCKACFDEIMIGESLLEGCRYHEEVRILIWIFVRASKGQQDSIFCQKFDRLDTRWLTSERVKKVVGVFHELILQSQEAFQDLSLVHHGFGYPPFEPSDYLQIEGVADFQRHL